jgi:hypothetical protein
MPEGCFALLVPDPFSHPEMLLPLVGGALLRSGSTAAFPGGAIDGNSSLTVAKGIGVNLAAIARSLTQTRGTSPRSSQNLCTDRCGRYAGGIGGCWAINLLSPNLMKESRHAAV